MKLAVGADHAGYALKEELLTELRALGHDVVDAGAFEMNPGDDYPDFAEAVARAVIELRAERGILICGSGVGASVAANKVPGIRAGLCHDSYSARQGVEHDNVNVLVLGARVIGPALAVDLMKAFLAASFSAEERHARRVAKIARMEAEFCRVAESRVAATEK